MITNNRQYRNFDFETKEMRVEGQAVTFENPTLMFEVDGMQFYEVISRSAFEEAKIDDVVLVIDHKGKPAAKTKNGTLELKANESGLFISADLSRNATGRELHEDIENGFYDKMSFAFTISSESYDKKTRTRRIEKIDRLYDVSAVTFPAYENTSINARSFFEVEAEKENKLNAEAIKHERAMNELKQKVGKE